MVLKATRDFVLLAVRPLSLSPTIKDWWEIVQMMITVGGFTYLQTISPKLVELLTTAPTASWQARLIVGTSSVAILFLIAGVRMAYRARRAQTPVMTFIFDPKACGSCQMPHYLPDENGLDQLRYILWRVGVQAPRGRAIGGVEVRLSKFIPQNAPFLPAALHPTKYSASSPTESTPSRFDLAQGALEFVDVIRWNAQETDDRKAFSIQYHQWHWPRAIPQGDYVFTLEAVATNAPKSIGQFRIWYDSSSWHFRAAKQ